LGWRKSFAASATLLKEAMTNRGDIRFARLNGCDVLPLAAARTGCLPLAERAMANFSFAAAAGDHALAGKPTGYGGVWLTDPRVLPAAAERSDVKMLRFLIDRGATTQSLEAIATAAKAGSVACVRLLIDSGFCFPPVPVRDVRTVSHRFNSDLA
jgi:hypothetical protein